MEQSTETLDDKIENLLQELQGQHLLSYRWGWDVEGTQIFHGILSLELLLHPPFWVF